MTKGSIAMTAYHLYTRIKHVKWYDPFRLEEQTVNGESTSAQANDNTLTYPTPMVQAASA